METPRDPLIEQLRAEAMSARMGDYPRAALEFNRCAVLLEQCLEDKAAHAQANRPPQAEVTQSLQTILLLLKNKDWVAIADVIDFELIPLWYTGNPV